MCQQSKDYLGPVKQWWELHLARVYDSIGVKPFILKQKVVTQAWSGSGRENLVYYKNF